MKKTLDPLCYRSVQSCSLAIIPWFGHFNLKTNVQFALRHPVKKRLLLIFLFWLTNDFILWKKDYDLVFLMSWPIVSMSMSICKLEYNDLFFSFFPPFLSFLSLTTNCNQHYYKSVCTNSWSTYEHEKSLKRHSNPTMSRM